MVSNGLSPPAEKVIRANLQSMNESPARDQALRACRAAHSDAGQKPRIQLLKSNQGKAVLLISDVVGNHVAE